MTYHRHSAKNQVSLKIDLVNFETDKKKFLARLEVSAFVHDRLRERISSFLLLKQFKNRAKYLKQQFSDIGPTGCVIFESGEQMNAPLFPWREGSRWSF